MAVQIHSTGPAAVFVSPIRREDNGLVTMPSGVHLLGWCERSPEIVIEHHATPLYNTLGGVELPYTYFSQGSEAVITCTFTRWNDFIATSLENTIRDTLVLEQSLFTHRSTVGVGIFYTYASVADPTHRSIDVFPFVRLVDVVRNEQGGMGEKLTVVFAAQRVHVSTRAQFSADSSQVPWIGAFANSMVGFGEMSLGGGGGIGTQLGNNMLANMFVMWPNIIPTEV